MYHGGNIQRERTKIKSPLANLSKTVLFVASWTDVVRPNRNRRRPLCALFQEGRHASV